MKKLPRPSERENALIEFQSYILKNDEEKERTDTVTMAKALALAGLPKRRTKEKTYKRVMRIGKNQWAQVTYATTGELPYGQDRLVLMAIQDLALRNSSPVVFFQYAGEVLKRFDIPMDGRGYERLRQRFKRIRDLWISIRFAERKEDLEDAEIGENMLAVKRFMLPTRKELEESQMGQEPLNGLMNDPDFDHYPYGVLLSTDFWEHLQKKKNHLIAPLELVKPFRDMPGGLDFLSFLIARCGSAKRKSVIPHEEIIPFFRDGKEEDRNVIRRLEGYLELIKTATDNRLKASFVHDGFFPSAGRGRPKKIWNLVVEPKGKWFVWSGKDAVPKALKEEKKLASPQLENEPVQEQSRAYLELKQIGLEEKFIQEQLDTHDEDYIFSNLAYVQRDFTKKRKKGEKVESIAGFVRRALEKDYAKNDRKKIEWKQEQQKQEQQHARAEKEKAELEMYQEKYTKFLSHCLDEALKALKSDELDALLDEFEGRIETDFAKEQFQKARAEGKPNTPLVRSSLYEFLEEKNLNADFPSPFEQWLLEEFDISTEKTDDSYTLTKPPHDTKIYSVLWEHFEMLEMDARKISHDEIEPIKAEFVKTLSRYHAFEFETSEYAVFEYPFLCVLARHLPKKFPVTYDLVEFAKGEGLTIKRVGKGCNVWNFEIAK